jgi:hypothetical protein
MSEISLHAVLIILLRSAEKIYKYTFFPVSYSYSSIAALYLQLGNKTSQ